MCACIRHCHSRRRAANLSRTPPVVHRRRPYPLQVPAERTLLPYSTQQAYLAAPWSAASTCWCWCWCCCWCCCCISCAMAWSRSMRHTPSAPSVATCFATTHLSAQKHLRENETHRPARGGRWLCSGRFDLCGISVAGPDWRGAGSTHDAPPSASCSSPETPTRTGPTTHPPVKVKS